MPVNVSAAWNAEKKGRRCAPSAALLDDHLEIAAKRIGTGRRAVPSGITSGIPHDHPTGVGRPTTDRDPHLRQWATGNGFDNRLEGDTYSAAKALEGGSQPFEDVRVRAGREHEQDHIAAIAAPYPHRPVLTIEKGGDGSGRRPRNPELVG